MDRFIKYTFPQGLRIVPFHHKMVKILDESLGLVTVATEILELKRKSETRRFFVRVSRGTTIYALTQKRVLDRTED